MRTELQGSASVSRHAKGVVHHNRDLVLVRERLERREVGDIEGRVPDRLYVDALGVFVDLALDRIDVAVACVAIGIVSALTYFTSEPLPLAQVLCLSVCLSLSLLSLSLSRSMYACIFSYLPLFL